jgi:ribonuclease Z
MVVYEEGGVVVRAYGVDHSPVAPALGYRVEFGGRSVGISGDTVDTSGLRALADGADILVSEVMDKGFALDAACAFERLGDERNARLLRDVRTYHIDVAELAQLSVDAGVGTLVLTHQVPSVPPDQAQALFEAPIARVFDGPIVVAEDGTRMTIGIE